jgi:hypothetical protein
MSPPRINHHIPHPSTIWWDTPAATATVRSKIAPSTASANHATTLDIAEIDRRKKDEKILVAQIVGTVFEGPRMVVANRLDVTEGLPANLVSTYNTTTT